MSDTHITIEPRHTFVGDMTILTVGRLREILAEVDPNLHVVTDNDGWYNNVGEVAIPGPDGKFNAVTLFSSGEVDSRQF